MAHLSNTFQLYQTLCQGAKSRDITVEDKQFIIDNIFRLDEEGKEALFLLIFEHNKIIKKIDQAIDKTNLVLPYKIKNENDELIIDIQKLPTKLRQIILKFIKIVISNEYNDDLEIANLNI